MISLDFFHKKEIYTEQDFKITSGSIVNTIAFPYRIFLSKKLELNIGPSLSFDYTEGTIISGIVVGYASFFQSYYINPGAVLSIEINRIFNSNFNLDGAIQPNYLFNIENRNEANVISVGFYLGISHIL